MTQPLPLVVVAGAGQGSGRAVVIECIRRGYAVAGLSRTAAHLDSLRGELGDGASRFTAHPVDLQDAAACDAALTAAIAQGGAVRALVNCAATWTGGRTVAEAGAADFRRSFDLNFFTALNPIHAVLRHWEARGRAGELAIVTLGATASTRGGRKTACFATAKCALRAMMQSLAKELGPEGVHAAHLVIDGLIDNPRTRASNAAMDASRFIAPQSIAAAVAYLIEQPRDCWTFETDLRPCNESW